MNEDISAEEVKGRIDAGTAFNLIDVREEWEYEEENIGAKLIPLAELPHRIAELESMKDEEVVVHCKSGRRSQQAQKFMLKGGFKNVRNMTGGILAYLEL